MARPKKAIVELRSIEECVKAMSDLLVATTDLEVLTAERDLAVAKASALFEPRMDDARTRRAQAELSLQNYYYSHLADLEKEGKHHRLSNGVIGRRDNPAKLALKNRSWTWAAVLVLLRQKFGDRFLRMKEPEIDKDLVKAELGAEELAVCGLKLDQDETFYAEPDRLPEAS